MLDVKTNHVKKGSTKMVIWSICAVVELWSWYICAVVELWPWYICAVIELWPWYIWRDVEAVADISTTVLK